MFREKVALSAESVGALKKRCYFQGTVMILLGAFALLMPLFVSMTLQSVIGWLLVVTGGVQGLIAWRAAGQNQKDVVLLTGGLAVVAFLLGLVMCLFPLAGAVTLGLLVALYLLVEGVSKLGEWWRFRSLPGTLWLLASGAIAVVAALLLVFNWLGAARVPGYLLGVALLSSGLSALRLGTGCSEHLIRIEVRSGKL